MKLGAYTACLHDKSLEEALTILRDLGLNSVEINSGGFIGTPHLPVEELLESAEAREKYLAIFPEYGIELTALNCNGNPLHPDPEVHHAEDLKRSIKLAGLLGIKTVITMSGLPGTDPDGKRPSWTVIPWDSVYKETLDYQWNEVALPFWKEIQELAAEHDVQVAIEMHPHNLVFNPATMKRLVELTTPEGGKNHVGAEMDPSHLFWQHIDPIKAVEDLGAAGVLRRRQGHADPRDGRRQRGARRPVRVDPRRGEPGRARRPLHRHEVARGSRLVLRRGGPRPRRRLLGPLPHGHLQGGP